MSAPAITDGQRANWAVAWAMQARTRDLSPALRRAYSAEPFGVPDRVAIVEAKKVARSIHRALVEAARLALESEAPFGPEKEKEKTPPNPVLFREQTK